MINFIFIFYCSLLIVLNLLDCKARPNNGIMNNSAPSDISVEIPNTGISDDIKKLLNKKYCFQDGYNDLTVIFKQSSDTIFFYYLNVQDKMVIIFIHFMKRKTMLAYYC